jgi:GAF domain-containing protein
MAAWSHNGSPGPEDSVGLRHLLLPPDDVEAAARTRRLRELGIDNRPIPEFDDFARELATITNAPFAMVNFIDGNRQYFAGLFATADTTAGPDSSPTSSAEPGRVMERDRGYCVYVVRRRRALVLDDLRDYPRFAVNPVVDEIGVHSYMGAPLIDHTGTSLGTICVVDQEPHAWGREGLATIKKMADRMVEQIERGNYTTGKGPHGRPEGL